MKHKANKPKGINRIFGLITLCLLSLSAVTARAQVTGTVTDTTGEPMIGATIIVEGSKEGTSADFDGKFTIAAKPGNVLRVSSIGYNPETVKVVDGKNHYDIVLTENSTVLDDIVVVGYGTRNV